MTLAELKEYLYGCTHCGTCKEVLDIFSPACPSGEMYGLESYYPSGKILIARGLTAGALELDDAIMERIYACTGCLSCEQQCGVYHHQHIFEVVQALRTEAVTQGFLNPAYMVMVDSLKKDDNVFGKDKAERSDWAKDLDIKEAPIGETWGWNFNRHIVADVTFWIGWSETGSSFHTPGKFGDLVFTEERMAVSSIEKIYEKEPVFDLEIERYHTYFVSIADGVDVLVHNDGYDEPLPDGVYNYEDLTIESIPPPGSKTFKVSSKEGWPFTLAYPDE